MLVLEAIEDSIRRHHYKFGLRFNVNLENVWRRSQTLNLGLGLQADVAKGPGYSQVPTDVPLSNFDTQAPETVCFLLRLLWGVIICDGLGSTIQ
jgi:hypothetical protein